MHETRVQQDHLFFKLCSDHLSIEAIPRKHISINLEAIKARKLKEYDTIMWTPHFVVLKNRNGEEITVRKDGRMIIRKAGSEAAAQQAASDALDQVLAVCGL